MIERQALSYHILHPVANQIRNYISERFCETEIMLKYIYNINFIVVQSKTHNNSYKWCIFRKR